MQLVTEAGVDHTMPTAEMETTEALLHSTLNVCKCNDMGELDYSQTYAMYNFVVVMVILPFVSAFGIFSNFINCYVFTRPSLASSVNVYLLALSCSDLLVVSTGVFVFYSDSVRVYFPVFTDVATQGIIWVLPLGFIAQTCSVYFTVAAAADCYAKVCWHPLSVNWCTTYKAKLYTVAIAAFSIGYNALRFWQFELNPCWDELHNASNIEVCPTELYYDIGVIYNVYMYMVLMTVLPFMLLSFLNVLILRTVQRLRHMNKKLCAASLTPTAVAKNGAVGHRLGRDETFDDRSPTSDTSDDKKLAPGNNAASSGGDDSVVTMVMVVILFLACNTLALIVNIVETFFDPDPLVVQYMTDTSNLLVVFNSSVNYVIYMLFDTVYRNEFKRCVYCKTACRRVRRVPTVYERGEKRNGSSPILYSSRHVPLETDETPVHQKRVVEFGEYLSVPTSPSARPAVHAPKTVSRFRSLDDDRGFDDMAMAPLMTSSDGYQRSGKKLKSGRSARVEAVASPS